jgi:hypothetical protein
MALMDFLFSLDPNVVVATDAGAGHVVDELLQTNSDIDRVLRRCGRTVLNQGFEKTGDFLGIDVGGITEELIQFDCLVEVPRLVGNTKIKRSRT